VKLTSPWSLRSETASGWADAVATDTLALLSDHAQCELKAAASAMTLLKRNPDRPGFALRLAPLIREEIDHLQQVLRLLDQRGATLGRDQNNPYAAGLLRFSEENRAKGEGHLDALLISALIEKRSHERFCHLQQCAALEELSSFYKALAESEQRHGELFIELALETYEAETVGRRYDTLAQFEGTLITGLPFAHRVHSGPP
jgi:tRNA-(ms[2]io[6]A)-hydroxylase